MKGIEMMLKAFGVDPETIKQEFEKHLSQAATQAKATIIHFNNRFDIAEARLINIENKLDVILKHIGVVEIDAAENPKQLSFEGTLENGHSEH